MHDVYCFERFSENIFGLSEIDVVVEQFVGFEAILEGIS